MTVQPPAPEPVLVVDPADVADDLGLDIEADERAARIVRRAVLTAQGQVRAYLGQPIVPTTFTDRGCFPYLDGWRLEHEPILSITAVVPEVDGIGELTGYFTVTYVAGLDARTDPDLEPIRSYVAFAAGQQQAVLDVLRKQQPAAGREVSSVSTDGQSVSYTSSADALATRAKAQTAAQPSLESLDYWRVAGRRIFMREGTGPGPFDLFGQW